jgi:hypothetical protein
MTTGIWIGLGIFLFAVVAGTIWVGYQVLRSWKHMRGLTGLVDEVGQLNQNVVDLQQRVTSVEGRVADLQRQVDGLSVTLARARVLSGAAREVRGTFESVRGFLPTK